MEEYWKVVRTEHMPNMSSEIENDKKKKPKHTHKDEEKEELKQEIGRASWRERVSSPV